MSAGKDFFEAVSKDPALKAEVMQATDRALAEFLKEKGLEEESAAAVSAAVDMVAATYGFEPEENYELTLDELDAVAGGFCACFGAGGGTDVGKKCACVLGGVGKDDYGNQCVCFWYGEGGDADHRVRM